MLAPDQAVCSAILLCVAGAAFVWALGRKKTFAGWLTFLITLGAAILVLMSVAGALQMRGNNVRSLSALGGFAKSWNIVVDGLSAVFLMITAFLAVHAALFSITYMRRYPVNLNRYYPYFLLFLAATYGLLTSRDTMWGFVLFWQLLIASGYGLIRFENRKPESGRAANRYLLVMEAAVVLVMLGTLLLRPVGIFGAAELPSDLSTVSALVPAILRTGGIRGVLPFALFLLGFGIQMGMWPFGEMWIPQEAPVTPSPASAMLSGVMIKIGIYGLLRHFIWLVPVTASADYPLRHWGIAIASLGTITLFIGTMQALKQEHMKRLLAFHSIGQAGYVLFGIGTAMALLATSTPAAASLATVALVAAIFHALNHSLFKGLLYLNAGSVLQASGTEDLNQLGGLMKFMPLTAITALVASLAISGVPLLNGFVSKWMLCVAAIQGAHFAPYLARFAAVAILISTVTLASFIKFFGTAFLSRSSALVQAKVRSADSGRRSLEVDWMMQLPQLSLAALCVLLGVVPGIAIAILLRALAASREGLGVVLADAKPMSNFLSAGLAIDSSAVFAPLILVGVLGATLLVAYGISRLGSAPKRKAEPWLCGYAQEADCNRYSAHHFYPDLKRYFHWLGGSPPSVPPRR